MKKLNVYATKIIVHLKKRTIEKIHLLNELKFIS